MTLFKGLKRFALVILFGCGISVSGWTTPSTTFWSPCTPYLQPFGVLHITYDTYYRSNSALPINTGLTIGVLPFDKLQVEAGIDVFYPTFSASSGKFMDFPAQFNFKVGSPENLLFTGAPGWSLGVFGIGLEKDVNDQNVVHLALGKTFPVIGILQIGGFYGMNKNLFMSSKGTADQIGLDAGWFSPDIPCPGVSKLVLAADLMTGKNALGAYGGGIYVFFTPQISLLTGPVFFNDPDLYGGNNWIWTLQLDVDISLLGK